ncbi:MAG TPA: hypothetical protein VM513_27765 [Kofleriaceae bacterium]|nr:hypothetical protein [Kofleriaceae bacterium]
MTTIYLAAIAFGVTLLLASILLGGKDTDHGDGPDTDVGLAWAPVMSLRFWVFFLAFGGGAGYALTRLGSSEVVSAVGALGIGWAAGAVAVLVVHKVSKESVSSDVTASELVGVTGTLVLPVGPGKPGKVRVEIKGRSEDFVATLVEDGAELPTGTPVLIVAEGDRGSLLVAKTEM